jgi:hypothetical protein
MGDNWRSAINLQSDEKDELRVQNGDSDGELNRSIISVLTALQGVELKRYTHLYLTRAGNARMELPRFGNDVAFETTPAGEWRSVARPAYVLSRVQIHSDRLRGFASYITLTLSPRTPMERMSCIGRPSQLLLMPEGSVGPGAARPWQPQLSLARVELSNQLDSRRRFALIEWNDAQLCWSAADARDRLQLAAVLAYVHTPIPERGGLPAAQALELLRATSFEPLSKEGIAALVNCFSAAFGVAPLRLRCWQLGVDFQALQFCNEGLSESEGKNKSDASLFLDHNAVTLYQRDLKRGLIPGSLRLNSEEAERVGLPACGADELCREPYNREALVLDVDQRLFSLLQDEAAPTAPCTRAETLDNSAKGQHSDTLAAYQTLAGHFSRQAEKSRAAQEKVRRCTLRPQAAADAIDLAERQLPLMTQRQTQLCEDIEMLLGLRDARGQASSASALTASFARAGGLTSTPTVSDVLRLTWSPSQAELLAARGVVMTQVLYRSIRRKALAWADVCSCHQRLQRIKIMAEAADDPAASPAEKLHAEGLLGHELQAQRLFNAGCRPWWIAMEVAGDLAIRPKQLAVAEDMLSRHGHNVQLNMGEGKTSVILPLLALHFAHAPKDEVHLPRPIFPPELVTAGAEQLRRHLTRGPSRIAVVNMAFHRQAQLNVATMGQLERTLQRLLRYGGALVAAPNNILSLYLKCDEIRLKEAAPSIDGGKALSIRSEDMTERALRGVLTNVPWADILDESDETLRPSYQLIYACGSRRPLPAAKLRCTCLQWLLRLLQWAAPSRKGQAAPLTTELAVLREMLSSSPCFLFEVSQDASDGTYPALRIVPTAPNAKKDCERLTSALLEALLAAKPRELMAFCDLLNELPTDQDREHVMAFVLNGSTGDELLPEPLKAQLQQLRDADVPACKPAPRQGSAGGKQRQPDTAAGERALLMLRGLLGHGLLLYTLEKQVQVHYGKDERRLKKIAVPFRAHNKPDPRSDFASADVAIVLTHLTYFYLGLNEDELREAVERLLKMPQIARSNYYKEWYRSACLAEHGDERLVSDTADSLNLEHQQQWSLLQKHLSFNFEVICFWLTHCVLERDLIQYPARLMATPWTLAHPEACRHRAGFSGTNDTCLLMPDSMQPQKNAAGALFSMEGTGVDKAAIVADQLTALQATEADMDDLLLEQEIVELPADDVPQWARLLRLATERHVDAIIDAGACLVGTTARQAAKQLLNNVPTGRHDGVIFWEDSDVGRGEWHVLTRNGSDVIGTPRRRSPLQDSQCFVIYGQAQCRGQDLRLRADAVALLTLDRQLPQDVLKQAAGRLRQLGGGRQRLLYVMAEDTWQEVMQQRPASEGEGALTARDILRWARMNTVRKIEADLLPRVEQSLHFHDVTLGGQRPDRPEQLGIAELYFASRSPHPLNEVVDRRLAPREASASGADQDLCATPRALLRQHTLDYGREVIVETAQEQEVEREEEQERETEREVERQVAALQSRSETVWDYSQVCQARTCSQLPSEAAVMHFSDACTFALAREAQWTDQEAQLCFTANFLRTAGEGAEQHGAPMFPVSALSLRLIEYVLWWAKTASEPTQVLVISGREADGILRVSQTLTDNRLQDPDSLRGRGRTPRQIWLVSVAALQNAYDGGWRGEATSVQGPQAAVPLTGTTGGTECRWGDPGAVARLLARLKLFNGCTMFGPDPSNTGDPRYDALRTSVLVSEAAKRAAPSVLHGRDKTDLYVSSDLETLCGPMENTVTC